MQASLPSEPMNDSKTGARQKPQMCCVLVVPLGTGAEKGKAVYILQCALPHFQMKTLEGDVPSLTEWPPTEVATGAEQCPPSTPDRTPQLNPSSLEDFLFTLPFAGGSLDSSHDVVSVIYFVLLFVFSKHCKLIISTISVENISLACQYYLSI